MASPAKFIVGAGFDGRPAIIFAASTNEALAAAIRRNGPTAVIEHRQGRMAWAVPLTERTARWFLIPSDLQERP